MAAREPETRAKSARPALVDAHVHFHPCFDEDLFLDSAAENFRRAAAEAGLTPDVPGCLCFTETAGSDYLRTRRDTAWQSASGRWGFHPTGEAISLVARSASGEELVLIAGRQIVSTEGLEVLALGCEREIPDGLPARDTIDAVLAADALPVLPWGFGKWWLRRGALAADLVRTSVSPRLFLGDNGGRLHRSPRPPLFRVAEARGLLVLPGSDPLPFAEQARKVGGRGFVLAAGVERGGPAASLKDRLRRAVAQPATYGTGENLLGFFRSQVGMQLRKRIPRAPSTP
ncbi:MAG: hypothetical protein M3409_03315 [Gemmatimonadota bacterium]|jgi:hypothetical protein|nr:hypothetical protein [Gemmatimonadota bacterium]